MNTLQRYKVLEQVEQRSAAIVEKWDDLLQKIEKAETRQDLEILKIEIKKLKEALAQITKTEIQKEEK